MADHRGPDDYRRLWQTVSTVVESVVRKDLYRHGIRNPAAAEEAVSLVMDHLRRLSTQGVVKFDCNQTAVGYLVWLSGRRSRDVPRSLRRRREFSLEDAQAPITEPLVDSDFDQMDGADGGDVDRLNEAIKALDDRSRLAIDRHLAGEPQAVTAKAPGVCDGTITRIRQRAIQKLRETMSGTAAVSRRSKHP